MTVLATTLDAWLNLKSGVEATPIIGIGWEKDLLNPSVRAHSPKRESLTETSHQSAGEAWYSTTFNQLCDRMQNGFLLQDWRKPADDDALIFNQ